jgi:hypothetical protein
MTIESYECLEIEIKSSFNLVLGFNLIMDFWTWKIVTSKVVHFTKDYGEDFFNKKILMIKKLTLY